MIIVGTVMACAAGVGLPVHVLMFGEIINNFVYYSIAVNFSVPLVPNATCSPTQLASDPLLFAQVTGMDSSQAYFCNGTGDATSQGILVNLLFYVCEPSSALQSEVGMYSIYYVILATGVLVAIFLANVFWNVSAYRQTKRIRRAFYYAILRQEIGWFDVNDSAELSTRLAE